MRTMGMTLVLFGVAGLAGCGHYRQHQQEQFARQVADRCVEAAARPTQVVIVPASSAAVAVPAPEK